MSAGKSLYSVDNETIAGQASRLHISEPAPDQAFAALPPEAAELAAGRAGTDDAAEGGVI